MGICRVTLTATVSSELPCCSICVRRALDHLEDVKVLPNVSANMSANLTPPTLVMNPNGTRQQVPLRDYLNARIAPFLKKAMTESLASEAEFPLQWLGECLTHQSMLYEGNPDTTGIRERFRYNFEMPTEPPQEVPQEEPQAQAQTTNPASTNGVAATETASTDSAAQVAASIAVPPADAPMLNGEMEVLEEQNTQDSTQVPSEQPPTAPAAPAA